MKAKKLLAGALVLALMYAGLAAHAQATTVVKLPAGLKIIAEEAFLGSMGITRVEVPSGTMEIRAKAFAGSGLREISLPASMKTIAEDAFEGCENLLIEAVTGSYALQWASDRGYAVMETEAADPSQGEDELPWVPACE